MNTPRSRRPRAAGLLLAALAMLAAGSAGALDPDPRELPAPPPDAEGLQRVQSSKVDEFYLRPGSTFTAYRRVRLAPVEVSFGRLWERQHREVDARQTARLRTDFARVAQQEFKRQLGRAGGYPAADGPGPDVLDVRASIVDLDIYAPDTRDSAVRRSYVLRAGQATLVAELRDSQTGTLLARVIDRREMREYPDFQLANDVMNSAEARDLVGLWSRLLRRYLDTARADGKG